MSDASEPQAEARAAQLLDDHAKIALTMERVRQAADLGELLARLAELRTAVMPHFAAEAAPGGFFDLLRARATRAFGRLAELEREHQALLAELERIEQAARACLTGPVAAILRDGAALAARMAEHEARENDLFADVLYTDIGAQ